MKICLEHWAQLRAAMVERGLDRFVSGDGQKAMGVMMNQLDGEKGREAFDPLLNANFAIWSNALEMGGIYMMGADEQGNEYCPLCEVGKHPECGMTPEGYIRHAADDQLEEAKKLGLIPLPS